MPPFPPPTFNRRVGHSGATDPPPSSPTPTDQVPTPRPAEPESRPGMLQGLAALSARRPETATFPPDRPVPRRPRSNVLGTESVTPSFHAFQSSHAASVPEPTSQSQRADDPALRERVETTVTPPPTTTMRPPPPPIPRRARASSSPTSRLSPRVDEETTADVSPLATSRDSQDTEAPPLRPTGHTAAPPRSDAPPHQQPQPGSWSNGPLSPDLQSLLREVTSANSSSNVDTSNMSETEKMQHHQIMFARMQTYQALVSAVIDLVKSLANGIESAARPPR